MINEKNEKLLILPYLCDDYEESYSKNNGKFELLNLICDRLSNINSYMEKFIKEIIESKILKEKLSSSKSKDNFIELFSIIQKIIDTALNENYKMINKIIELLTDLKQYYTSYFKKYDNYIKIQEKFANKLVDIDNCKDNFLKSTKKAEIFTYQFLKNKIYDNSKINKNDYYEKEDLKQLAKKELDKYKSIIEEGNIELKVLNDNQKRLFRAEKELNIKYTEIYSTSIMTSLEYQLKINQYSDKLNDKILKINNNNHVLLDYLKNYKPKEKIEFVKYHTNI